MVIHAYTLPAIVAFVAKLALLLYAARSPTRDIRTRLFVTAVLVSLALNVIEIAAFQGYFGDAVAYAGYAYYVALGGLLAVLTHLTVWVAFDYPPYGLRVWFVRWIYGHLLVLVFLVVFSESVIAGFVWLGGYTLTRVAGPLYWLFEIFAVMTLLTILLLPIRGIRQRRDGRLRSRCEIWMLAAAPACLLVITVLTLLRLNIVWFNATVTLPLPMALLLAAIAYCVHNNRIVDLSCYFPFTRVRRSKRALRASLAALADEAPRTASVQHLIDRLGSKLDCPVCLVGPGGLVCSEREIAARLADVPLQNIHQIAVTEEVGGTLRQLMQRNGLGAIIPLFPTSATARSWLVFGDAFGARIYTPADFRTVDQVVRQLAGLLLDELLKHGPVSHPLTVDDQMKLMSRESTDAADSDAIPPAHHLAERLARYEAFLIEEALRACKGNKAKAARLLGLQPNTLHYKLKRLGPHIRKE